MKHPQDAVDGTVFFRHSFWDDDDRLYKSIGEWKVSFWLACVCSNDLVLG
jgi:hypothetical protein